MSDAVTLASPNTQADLLALNAFAAHNPDLDRLEDILAQFNLFEAIGIVRHEIKHSNLLAFLFDPARNHGLGDAFLQRFLQEVSPEDKDGWAFETVDVRREWRNTDVLLIDEKHRFALLIENKIDTSEHSGQLERYYEIVQREWPEHKILALYLTPNGDAPSHPDYVAIDYGVVCGVVEAVSTNLPPGLDPGVPLLLTHYAQMLKRHIMTNTEVAKLSRSIYAKHRRALDLIYEHKPDLQAEIGVIASRLVAARPVLKYLSSGKQWLSYCPCEWESAHGDLSETLLYLTFDIQPQRLDFTVETLGEGDTLKNERQKLHEMARRAHWPGMDPRVNRRATTLYRFQVLRADDYGMPREELEERVMDKWHEFLDRCLPNLLETIREEKWLWEAP